MSIRVKYFKFLELCLHVAGSSVDWVNLVQELTKSF